MSGLLCLVGLAGLAGPRQPPSTCIAAVSRTMQCDGTILLVAFTEYGYVCEERSETGPRGLSGVNPPCSRRGIEMSGQYLGPAGSYAWALAEEPLLMARAARPV